MTPPLEVVYSPYAEIDVHEAVLWLNAGPAKLGSEFLDELYRLEQRIRRHPNMYQRFRGAARRAVLSRFDFAVVYHPTPEGIEIVAVLHCRLDPRTPASRTADDA